jgi:hypothetical protein
MGVTIFVKSFDTLPSEIKPFQTARLSMDIFIFMYQYTSSYKIIIEHGMDPRVETKLDVLEKILKDINPNTFKNRIDFSSDGDLPAKNAIMLETFIPKDTSGYLILKQYFFSIKEDILHSMV